MVVLALIETGTLATNEVFDTNDNRGSLLDGDNILDDPGGDSSVSIVIGRAQVNAGGLTFTFNRRGGSGNFRDWFGDPGEPYDDATVYLQVGDVVVTLDRDDVSGSGGGFLAYAIPDNTGWRDAIDSLRTSGQRFIMGIGHPAPTGTDHAVDAGTASFEFVVSEPTVTKTSPFPQDHAVNAGDASFIFAVSEPTITHTRAHTVDAGDAAFAFVVSEPTVTHVMAAVGVMNWKTGGATITAAKHNGTAITRGKYNGVEFFAN